MNNRLKIAIVGRHPDLEIGFNGVMSINECIGFSALGHDVTLYLPVSESFNPRKIITTKKLNLLDIENGRNQFRIEILEPLTVLKKSYDLVIWQTYRTEDDIYLDKFRKVGAVLSKNFPRLFGYDDDTNRRKALGLAKAWDLPVCSLREDIDVLNSLGVEDNLLMKFKYVPRGFDQRLLDPSQKAGVPTIGFDKPIKAGKLTEQSIEHIRNALLLVKEAIPDLRVLSLAANDDQLNSIKVPWSGYRNFYAEFINKLWLYMPVDFRHTVHAKGYSRSLDGLSHRFIGLYENQVVETQMAGGLVVSRLGDIPEELLSKPWADVFLEDYNDSVKIADRVVDLLSRFSSRGQAARSFALQNHTLEIMASKWLEAYHEYAELRNSGSESSTPLRVPRKGDSQDLPVRMSPRECDAFEEFLSNADCYIEFGLGGSTVLAASLYVPRIYAVESDIEWIEQVNLKLNEKYCGVSNLLVHYADIGPTQRWGYPVKKLKPKQIEAYVSEIWKHVEVQVDENVVVMVDGRYRVACALNAVRALNQPFTLMVHDYVPRKCYHILEAFLGSKVIVDTMAIFKVDPNNYSLTDIDVALEAHVTDPR